MTPLQITDLILNKKKRPLTYKYFFDTAENIIKAVHQLDQPGIADILINDHNFDPQIISLTPLSTTDLTRINSNDNLHHHDANKISDDLQRLFAGVDKQLGLSNSKLCKIILFIIKNELESFRNQENHYANENMMVSLQLLSRTIQAMNLASTFIVCPPQCVTQALSSLETEAITESSRAFFRIVPFIQIQSLRLLNSENECTPQENFVVAFINHLIQASSPLQNLSTKNMHVFSTVSSNKVPRTLCTSRFSAFERPRTPDPRQRKEQRSELTHENRK